MVAIVSRLRVVKVKDLSIVSPVVARRNNSARLNVVKIS